MFWLRCFCIVTILEKSHVLGCSVRYQVVEIRVSGVRRKLLMDRGEPTYYPNLYVTTRLAARALNTQQKHLEHIALFKSFLKHESIDLVARLEERPNSIYLTDSEISRFVSDAGLRKSTLDQKYSGVKLLPKSYVTVGRIHAQQRLEAVRDYIGYLYNKLADEKTRDTAVKNNNKIFNSKIRTARPSWARNKLDDIKGLTTEERSKLLSIMRPDSPDNPFTSKALKLRNYIILLMGLEIGLRRSEMLLVKLNDIQWHSNKISIVDLVDEKIDMRTEAPQFKTHERELPIGEELSWALQQYVDFYREPSMKLTKKARHPFLLVSHGRGEGNALSTKALDGIMLRVGKEVPELKHIHLHVLRHDAVYKLLESMQDRLETLTPEDRTTETQKILTYAFGWSPESNMPGLYGAKFWKEEADKAMRRRSELLKEHQLIKKIGKD